MQIEEICPDGRQRRSGVSYGDVFAFVYELYESAARGGC